MSVLDVLMDMCRVEEKKNINVPTNKKSVQCYVDECTNNVPYRYLSRGVNCCKNCLITCRECEKKVSPVDAASGLYKGLCINCTRCDYCNVPMWDYVCSCEL